MPFWQPHTAAQHELRLQMLARNSVLMVFPALKAIVLLPWWQSVAPFAETTALGKLRARKASPVPPYHVFLAKCAVGHHVPVPTSTMQATLMAVWHFAILQVTISVRKRHHRSVGGTSRSHPVSGLHPHQAAAGAQCFWLGNRIAFK